MNAEPFGSLRLIDAISFMIAVAFMMVFWIDGRNNWLLNDIFAIAITVTCIKLFKLKTLYDAVIFEFTLLLIECAVGLFVHFYLHTSYNNLLLT